jgi:hypothetical protein
MFRGNFARPALLLAAVAATLATVGVSGVAQADVAEVSWVAIAQGQTTACSTELTINNSVGLIAGDEIFLGVGAKVATAPSAPSDSQGNTYSLVKTVTTGSATARTEAVFAASVSSSTASLTIKIPCDGQNMAVSGDILRPPAAKSLRVDATGSTTWANRSAVTVTTRTPTTSAGDAVLSFAYAREAGPLRAAGVATSAGNFTSDYVYHNTSGTSAGGDNVRNSGTAAWAAGSLPANTYNSFGITNGALKATYGAAVIVALIVT